MYGECDVAACGKDTPVEKMPIAMAYVPWQDWEELYEIEKAFECGTIFPCLDKPFVGGK